MHVLKYIVPLIFSAAVIAETSAQAQTIKELTIHQAMELSMLNHQQLKLSMANHDQALQQIEIAKLQQLPNIAATASAGYLGNVLFLDKDFSKVRTVDIPHFANSYAVQASELLYKGGLVKKGIQAAEIKAQLAALDLQNDQQAIKFLVASNYLDLVKLQNQAKVYANNTRLARLRLENVNKYYNQGIVTRNEVIRGELVLKNLEQAQLVVANNLAIVNYNLGIALGLNEGTHIVPTEVIKENPLVEDQNHLLSMALDQHPSLIKAEKNKDLAQKNTEIVRTDQYPALSAVGSYQMQRPYTNTSPALDMYANNWMVGLSLSYNIDNLYKTKRKIKSAKITEKQADEAAVLVKQNIEMALNAAYIKYQESLKNSEILFESQRLAQENYKIIEAKYLNQLAILAEMTDAINAKLEAELNYTNAQVNVLYQYYTLQRAIGSL
ncbi:TolC family protein [Sphingobacterium sp. Mn56C]|uniref:TolC family protein n=1 Tax=Sphingobacterium sp. Mn56C TaxID=3395261 RepID=UPI003BED1701